MPRDDQRELLRCFALADFEPRGDAAEEAELALLLPAMLCRRALRHDGARLLSAAATPRAAAHGHGGAPYTPSPAMVALAQQVRDRVRVRVRVRVRRPDPNPEPNPNPNPNPIPNPNPNLKPTP